MPFIQSYPFEDHYYNEQPAAYYHSPDLIQPRREYPNSIRLQQPINAQNPLSVEEALYILGKNFLGKNVTDRIFPVAKTIAKGMGQVGEGLTTFGELLPPVPELTVPEPLNLLPPGIVVDEEDYEKGFVRGPVNTQPRTEQQRIASAAPRCTTPSGGSGKCTDIQICPILLTDLENLRKSV